MLINLLESANNVDDSGQSSGKEKESSSHFQKRKFGRRKVGKLVLAVILVLVVVSLSIWTFVSPVPMKVNSESQLSESLFQFAKSTTVANFSDAEGTYSFLFGIDYNSSVASGQETIVSVYASLTSEHLNSGFARGVALRIESATVLFDGIEDLGVKTRITYSPNILIEYLTFVKVGENSGEHLLTARLIVSTVDVNYIGFFLGTESVVSLGGNLTVT